ncbi:MAG TPA: hypothetical protein VK302_00085 [Terriglobales bacterium]|nr:hypothetical protein [Terriglobales bacterium]
MKTPREQLLEAAISLITARSQQMVTSAEWDALALAVKRMIGVKMEWRSDDELKVGA